MTFKDGAPVRMVGICHDVTERIRLQEELRSRAKQQEALAQLGERALAETDIDRLLNDVVSTVAVTLPVDFVKVLELMPGDNDLLLRAGFGWKEKCVGSIVMSKERDGYARHILSAAAPLITEDFARETRFGIPQYLQSHGCVSGIEHHRRRPGRSGLRRSRRLHEQAAAIQRAGLSRSLPPWPTSWPAPFSAGNWSNVTN